VKTELERTDIEAIARRVMELIKPYLVNRRDKSEDIIFDVKGLAQYLKVDASWVYKQVSLNTIPYFKNGKYTRFRKSTILKTFK
jgi:hypothetical protein